MPTTIYTNNFDSASAGTLADFSLFNSANFVVGSINPISGTKSYGTPSGGGGDTYTGLLTTSGGSALATIANVGLRYDFVYSGSAVLCPILLSDSTHNNCYTLALGATTVFLLKTTAGSGALLGSGPVSLTSGSSYSILATATQGSGSVTIALTVWPYGSAQPGTPTFTYTDSSSPITTPGYAGLYLAGSSPFAAQIDNLVVTNLTGGSALTAGTATAGASTSTTASVSATDATGGTTPYSRQWYRSTASGSLGSAVSGATSLALNDSGLTASTTYFYTLKYTDSAGSPATVASNQVSLTTSAATSYVTIGVTSVGHYASPANHDDDGTGTKASATVVNNVRNGATKSWSQFPGSYDKFGWTTPVASANHAVLIMDVTHYGSVPSNDYPILKYRLASGLWQTAQVPSNGRLDLTPAGISGAGTYQVLIALMASDGSQDGYGATSGTIPISSVVITGLEVDAGSTPVAPPVASKSMIVFADSIGEGVRTLGTTTGDLVSNDSTLTWAWEYAAGNGYEVGFLCLGGWGYERPAGRGFPAFAANWPLQSNGRTRDTSIAVNAIFECQGTNDALGGVSSSTITTDVRTVLAGLRAAYPAAKITKMIPFGGFAASAIASGYSAYQSATPDANAALFTPSALLSAPISGPSVGSQNNYASADGVHPNQTYSGALAAALATSFSASTSGVYPSPANVRLGNVYGPTSNQTGTLVLPTAAQVLAGVTFDASTAGTIVLPTASQVRAGVTYGPGSTTTGTYAATYTAAANVRSGTDRGDGTLGTLNVPTASQVLASVAVDATTGTVVLPPASAVLSTFTFGPGSTTAGTVLLPATGTVQTGVTFGPGSSLTGTYAGSGGSGSVSDASVQTDVTAALIALGYTGARAAKLDYLDAAVSTRSTVVAPAYFASLAINPANGGVKVDGTRPILLRPQAGISAPTQDDALAAAHSLAAGFESKVGQVLTLKSADGNPFVVSDLDVSVAPTTRTPRES